MPLNTGESEEGRSTAGGESPFAPQPESGRPDRRRRILIWILVVVVFLSIFFLLIQFGVIPTGGGSGGPPPKDGTDAAPRSAAPGAAGAGPVKGPAAALTGGSPGFAPEYTIFIGALRDSSDAVELAGRWEKAGYPAYVFPSEGWYRVGLGTYPSAALARQDAEKLSQAFEDGYWIGRASL